MLKNNAKLIFYTLTLIGLLFIVNFAVTYFSKPDTELRMVAGRTSSIFSEKSAFIDNFYFNIIKRSNLGNSNINTTEILNRLNEQGVNLLQFKKNRLVFWSSNQIIVNDPSTIKTGNSFMKLSNGWYFVDKKKDGDLISLFFILVKNEYSFQNNYLENTFSPELEIPNYFKLADIDESGIVYVTDGGDMVLFGLKIDSILKDQDISIAKIIIERVCKINCVNHYYCYC